MKNRMKKMISLIMVLILLLAVFAGCGDSKRPTLSEEKKEAINEAWMKNENETLSWCDMDAGVYSGARYYGTFNGFDIIFKEHPSAVTTSDGLIVVANCEFRHPVSFVIYAYKDNVFHTLEEAYEISWLTEAQIKEIYDIHWYEYQKTLFPSFYANYESLKGVQEPASYVPPIDKEYLKEVESRWLEEFGYEIKWRDLERRHYDGAGFHGIISQCFIISLETNDMEQSNTQFTIGEYDFINPNNFVILAYREGEFYTLKEVYDNGWLKDSKLEIIWESYKSGVQFMYPEFYNSYYID